MIGGGITGAGVALDAASRGYSVALLERGDYAEGTSSRSSKMVHGGLRYLQNLDLGLVREALLERQLMVQLAPHLVYPTPFLVPAFGDERRDRNIGIGLNMYDVMATTRVGRSRREMRAAKEDDEDYYWSPDRHRTIDREELLELVPAAGAARPQGRLPLLRLPDRRRAPRPHHPRRGRALRRRDAQRRRGDRGARARRPRRRRRLRRGGVGRADRGRGRQRRQRDRRLGRPHPPGGDDRARRTCPRISPSRGTHVLLDREDLSTGSAACIVPAGEGRAIFALPWYGRTLVGTTDNDFDGDIDQPAAGRGRTSSTCSTRSTSSSASRWGRATWSAPTPACGR